MRFMFCLPIELKIPADIRRINGSARSINDCAAIAPSYESNEAAVQVKILCDS
jgi:hypothetical protein